MYSDNMVKMVSFSDEAYAVLTRYKKKNMSYSQVVISEMGQKRYVKTETKEDLLGFLKNLPKSHRKKRDLSKEIDNVIYGVKRA